MCTPEEREKRIREMMAKKIDKGLEKMKRVVEKITKREADIDDSQFISNSYGITDSMLWHQIAKGEEYIKSLDQGIIETLKNYTGCGYLTINGSLRRGQIDNTQHVRNIDYAFRHAPRLDAPMKVYRGIGSIKELRDDNGFSSCSLNKGISMAFGRRGKCFTITIPAGSRILFMKPISDVKGEDEVLIDRRGSFRELVEVGQLVYVSQLNEEDDD